MAGDVIYNGAHLYLSETSLAGFDAWRAAIDRVESLGARSIVAGHQNSKLDDDAARTIAETREYLDVAEELFNTEKTAVDYFNAMVTATRIGSDARSSGRQLKRCSAFASTRERTRSSSSPAAGCSSSAQRAEWSAGSALARRSRSAARSRAAHGGS